MIQLGSIQPGGDGFVSTLPTLAERQVRRRIANSGPITFAEFMAAALYGPGGYYTRPTAGGDYYTSPRIHPAFGALLAVQLFHLWSVLDRPRPFVVVEPGGGDGLLCRDILAASRHLPDGFGDAINYTVVDQLPAVGWEAGLPGARRLVADILSLDRPSVPAAVHCVLSNELLDALPVHRGRMEDGCLRELYVGLDADVADGYEGALVELAGDLSTPALADRLADLGVTLVEGQTAEMCLQLDNWAERVAILLDCGFALTIDYGRAAGDLYDPARRKQGTLVTYLAHRQTDAPLRDIGRQDITAQVDFTSVQRAGETAGLIALGNLPQGWFLQRLGLQTIRRNAAPSDEGAGGWLTLPPGSDGLPPETLPDGFTSGGLCSGSDDASVWRANLTRLAQPGGIGDFRVLLQAKGLPLARAAAALSWLDGEPTERGYSPASLAGLIPPEALTLGPERLRLTQ